MRAQVSQHIGNVCVQGNGLVTQQLMGWWLALVDTNQERLRPVIGGHREGMLDDVRCHRPDTQLDQKNFLVRVLVDEVLMLAHTCLPERSLQKHRGAEPRLHLRATARALGNQFFRDARARNVCRHLPDGFFGRVHVIVAGYAALQVVRGALRIAELLVREQFGKLQILIGRDDEVVLVLDQCMQIHVGLSRRLVVQQRAVLGQVGPAFLAGLVSVVKRATKVANAIGIPELAEIFPEVSAVSIEVVLIGCGHARCPTDEDRLRFFNVSGYLGNVSLVVLVRHVSLLSGKC